MDSQRTLSERDALFAILADPRRRRLLDILEAREPGASIALSELTDRLAADEGSTAGEHRHEIAVALHHVHLPMLDEADLVGYDPEDKVVELVDRSAGRPAADTDILVTDE